MIGYESFQLANGLRVFVHQDPQAAMAVVNVLYDVGSKDEQIGKTGFAHLFEHLMFGGSKNIPSFDKPLQQVGGINNAFTSPDMTNYYVSLPLANIETAFWLESDRMLSLSFDPKVLEVQRKVVIEEFKQRYLNQPYGDLWLKLRPLVYQKHPYRWATIGQDIEQIEAFTMDDVRAFAQKFYHPNNAILVVAGNISTSEVQKLSEKWFGSIPSGTKYNRNLPEEPVQTEARFAETFADVPMEVIVMAYQMPGKLHEDYLALDLLSDVLGRSKSSRLYERLVKQEKLFQSISAYVSGSIDPGMWIISGRPFAHVSLEKAQAAINKVLEEFSENPISEEELQKIKNQSEASWVFGNVELLDRAMHLAFEAQLGQPERVNTLMQQVHATSQEDIMRVFTQYIKPEKCATLFYRKK